jgi:5'-deoxynucleotidase YfbR-like HD superfamily hydrolase
VRTTDAKSPPRQPVAGQTPSTQDDSVARIVSAMLWSAELQTVKRYYDMTFWEGETAEERDAESVLSGPRLESVADHSWHLCDCVLLLHGHFGYLDLGRCLAMAVVHDKAEIGTGDVSPMGASGTGRDGTAFDAVRADAKEREEHAAVDAYLDSLPAEAARAQRVPFEEYLERRTAEARFVYVLDKMQVFTWLIRRKQGRMSDEHLRFSLRYLRDKGLAFVALEPLIDELERRLLAAVAQARGIPCQHLERRFGITSDPRTRG